MAVIGKHTFAASEDNFCSASITTLNWREVHKVPVCAKIDQMRAKTQTRLLTLYQRKVTGGSVDVTLIKKIRVILQICIL